MTSEAYAIAGWISIAIWLAIYVPITIHGIVLFYRYRFISVIVKRHVHMTLVILLCSLSHFCIDRVLWMVAICNLHASQFFTTASSVVFPIIFYGLMFSLLCRFWMLRYDIEFVNAQCDNKWRAVINADYIDEHNWFIQHRSTFGNTSYVASRLLVPLYLVCIAASILIRLLLYNPSSIDQQTDVYFNEQYRDCWIVDLCLMLIPYALIIYLWSKTPNINDTFWIRAEQRCIFLVLLALFLSNVVFGVSALYLKYEFVLLSILESHIICAANFCICLILTFAVFHQNRHAFQPQQQLQDFLAAQKKSGGSNASNQGKNRHNAHHQVRSMLKDSNIFHAFMAHLATEFSMECLLAIIEFTEYEEYVLDNFSDYVSSKQDYRSKLIQLPEDIPKSQIVFGSNTDHEDKPVLQSRCHSNSSHIHDGDQHTPPTPTPTLKADHSNTVIPLPLTMSTNSNVPSNHPLTAQHSNHENSNRVRRSPSRSKGLYADLKPLQVKAHLLYEKYIKVGSEYEINISGPMRNSVQSMLNNEALWDVVLDSSTKNSAKMQAEKIISEKLDEILTLLNECIDEMIKLLSHSFHRFQHTNGYDTLIKRANKINEH